MPYPENSNLSPSDIGTTVEAYDVDIPTVSASQAEMEAGIETGNRSMSPLRVAQAIAVKVTGVNTGDNAPNSQYSGLVTNATHTGDATGATALTVVKINGTLMSSLATGLLKNTNGTGVPSIATARTDYAEPTTALATGILKNTATTGEHTIATAGTDYSPGTSTLATGIVKSTTTTGALTIATAGDFPTLNQNTTGSSASCTGNSATVTTNANLTGAVISVGNTTALGSFTAAQLNTALSDADVATGGGTASGANTVDVTLAAIGAAPNANGASLSGQTLTLQPANATNGGIVTTGAQTFAGVKTLTSPVLVTPTLGTPVSGTVTNLTGTASININGTVGGTTPTTGVFTTISASGLISSSAGYQFRGADATVYELFRYTGGTNNPGLFVRATEATKIVELYQSGSTGGETLVLGNVATLSSTGLAVTGALSSTTGANLATSSGKVGIGTDSPANKLHIYQGASGGTAYSPAAFTIESSANTHLQFMCPSNTASFILFGNEFGNQNSWIRYSHPTNALDFKVNGAERLRIDSSGNVGIGQTAPTAVLHLKAGTAAASTAPLKLTSGTLNTTPEAGTIEYDGSHFYATAGSTRHQLDQQVSVSMGEVEYFDLTGTTVTIAGQSNGATNMVKVAPTTTGDFHFETDNGGADNGRIRYIGTTTKMFHCAITMSGTPQTTNDIFVLGVSKNGAAAQCKVLGSASGTQFSALHCMLSLATNDYIELFIGNTTAARNFTIKSLNIFMMGIN